MVQQSCQLYKYEHSIEVLCSGKKRFGWSPGCQSQLNIYIDP
uniref:Uncharacterized protein n=1 Tax=Anguilla anguilla TaxID=7936 RepID=A0A0E9QSY0_ANGAN